MLGRHIAAAGGAVLLGASLALTAASAQTAANQPAGKPLQLLKIVERHSKATTKPHAKVAAKPAAKRAIKVATKRRSHPPVAMASRKRPLPPLQTAAAAAPDTTWPAVQTNAPTQFAAAAPTPDPAPPAPLTTEPVPRELVVGGQRVQVAAPDDVNALDLAANDAASQTSGAAPTSATSLPPMSEVAATVPKSDYRKVAAVVEAPPSPAGTGSTASTASKVGSTSWILQVLAALGGAVTAGSVAWFLIGGTPQRTYG